VTPRLGLLLIGAFLLASATGCLYTKAQVERRFRVQVLEWKTAAIVIHNESTTLLQICSFGDTGRYCETSRELAPGGSETLDYRVARILRPIPGYPCDYDECLSVRAEAGDVTAESSDLVLIRHPRGLSISLRPIGNQQGSDIAVTNDVRDGPGCYRVVVRGVNGVDPMADSITNDAGDEVARARVEAVDCPAS